MNKCGLALNTVGDFVFALRPSPLFGESTLLNVVFQSLICYYTVMVFPEVGEFHLEVFVAVGFFRYFFWHQTLLL